MDWKKSLRKAKEKSAEAGAAAFQKGKKLGRDTLDSTEGLRTAAAEHSKKLLVVSLRQGGRLKDASLARTPSGGPSSRHLARRRNRGTARSQTSNGHTYYYYSKWARKDGRCRRIWQKYLGKLEDIEGS